MNLARASLLAAALAPALTAQTWTQVNTTTAPAPQGFQQSLAFDMVNGRVLLYGGRTSAPLAETWLFDGANWTLITPPADPGDRWGHRIVTDTNRARVILWGGRGSGTSAVSGTWEWDGGTWTQIPTANEPPLRAWHQMAFDSRRGVTVMFGGFAVLDNQTWEYDGTDWTAVTTATTPPRVGDGEMVYDASRGVTVLYGGFDGSTGAYAGTWEYDGTDWTQITTTRSPGNIIRHQMSYDSLRGQVVLVGGFDGTARQDTWSYDGTDWTLEAATGAFPTVPLEGGMTYDPQRDRHVFFGGRGPSGTSGDTNEYQALGHPSFAPAGPGCAGSAGVPVLAAATGSLPVAGQNFTAEVSNLPASTSSVVVLFGLDNRTFGPVMLPFELSIAGLPGCFLDHSNDVAFPVAAGGGTASWTLPIPAMPLGTLFWNQVFVPDPAAGNPAGAVLSNSCRGAVFL